MRRADRFTSMWSRGQPQGARSRPRGAVLRGAEPRFPLRTTMRRPRGSMAFNPRLRRSRCPVIRTAGKSGSFRAIGRNLEGPVRTSAFEAPGPKVSSFASLSASVRGNSAPLLKRSMSPQHEVRDGRPARTARGTTTYAYEDTIRYTMPRTPPWSLSPATGSGCAHHVVATALSSAEALDSAGRSYPACVESSRSRTGAPHQPRKRS